MTEDPALPFTERLSREDQHHDLSLFGLGGIHGLPYQEWKGSKEDDERRGNPKQWLGYCQHGSPLFPTWHRPYVAAYEVDVTWHSTRVRSLLIEPMAANFAAACYRNC